MLRRSKRLSFCLPRVEVTVKVKERRHKQSVVEWLTQGLAVKRTTTPSRTPAGAEAPRSVARQTSSPVERATLTSTLRSDVACWLFPDLPPRDAGIRVASDIMSIPALRHEMQQLGYRPRQVGYTHEMIQVLKQFYRK